MRAQTDQALDIFLDDAEGHRRLLYLPYSRGHRALRRRAASGMLVEPHPGYFCRKAWWDRVKRPVRQRYIIRSVSYEHPDWTFCGISAAVVSGFAVSYHLVDVMHVCTSASSRRANTASVRFHIVEGDSPVMADGVMVTSPERTVLDCLRTTGFGDGLAIADSAIRMTGVTRESFASYIDEARPLVGIGRARRTIMHANGLAESGGESIARAAIIEQGFALPRLQVPFQDPLDPTADYRVDFLWDLPDGSQVIGEMDGREKYYDPEMTKGMTALGLLTSERRRESRLTFDGAKVMRFSYREVCDIPYFCRLLDAYGIPRSADPAFPSSARRPHVGR